MHDIAPPGAEMVQKIIHALTMMSYRITTTIYEDESVKIVGRSIGHAVKIGLGVPW